MSAPKKGAQPSLAGWLGSEGHGKRSCKLCELAREKPGFDADVRSWFTTPQSDRRGATTTSVTRKYLIPTYGVRFAHTTFRSHVEGCLGLQWS